MAVGTSAMHPLLPELCPAQSSLGFERFYKGSEGGADGGEILISELGCVSCHLKWTMKPSPASAEIRHHSSTGIGSRLNLDYLERFVSDPSSLQPGTRMPGLFGEWPEAERNEAVRDLASFLATQGGPFQNSASPVVSEESKRGEELYHSVGCVACHAALRPPRLGYGDEEEIYREVQIETPRIEIPSAPLPNQRLKTALQPLADFLENPLETRPSGRMPQMGLKPGEARAIATYLLDESGPGQRSEQPHTSPKPIDPESGDRGRKLVLPVALCCLSPDWIFSESRRADTVQPKAAGIGSG